MKRFFLLTLLCSLVFIDTAFAMDNGQGAPAGSPPQIPSDEPAAAAQPDQKPPVDEDKASDAKPQDPSKDAKPPVSFLKTVGGLVGAGPHYFFDFGVNAWKSGQYGKALGTFGATYKCIHLMPYVGTHLREFFNEIPGHLAESIGEAATNHVVATVNGVVDGAMMYTFAHELEQGYAAWQQAKKDAAAHPKDIEGRTDRFEPVKEPLNEKINPLYENGCFVWGVVSGILANYAAKSQFVKKLEHSAAEKIKASWLGKSVNPKEHSAEGAAHQDATIPNKQEAPLYVNGKLVSSIKGSTHNENAAASYSNADFIFTINGHQPSTLFQYAKEEGSKLIVHYALYKVGCAILNAALVKHQNATKPNKV